MLKNGTLLSFHIIRPSRQSIAAQNAQQGLHRCSSAPPLSLVFGAQVQGSCY